MDEMIQEMPVLPLKRMTILPGMATNIDVQQQSSILAVNAALRRGGKIFVVTQRNEEAEEATENDLYRTGVIGEVRQVMKLEKDMLRVVLFGQCRAELGWITQQEEFLKGEIIRFAPEEESPSPEAKEAMLRSLEEALTAYRQVVPRMRTVLRRRPKDPEGLELFMDQIGNAMPAPYERKQALLEQLTLAERYEVLMQMLQMETEVTKIKNDLQQKTKLRIDKNQREYVLREQMKVIRQELGEEDFVSDAEQFLEKIKTLEAKAEVKERLEKEVRRFKAVAANASESSVIRTWLETMVELPWEKTARENTDLAHARQILDEDHYGLDKVKERVLEFLAVRRLTSGGQAPILCLVGPPGTGKTSIAQSVARALEKPYTRISLGGVRDEAEIRGHRRTYIGAMAGRIVQGLKNAGVKNPLMLLDEIDKMSSDYKGDTASAMLEVLDSAQNMRFNDHYVDMPVDLSEVFFIATANEIRTIPKPLLDRMEVIEIGSYTANEKRHIAREHLIAKQKQVNGLADVDFTLTDEALDEIILAYTREAGVRSLERKIGQLCRKAARQVYEEKITQICVTKADLEDYLGRKKYRPDEKNEADEVGVVRGLAWTSMGGTTLQIEVNLMPGKGELKLTGQLGDVMKESAQTAISYLRSIAADYGVEADFFTTHDLHIHIPEGAVPKDGPSAGITMATAMLSAISHRRVRADVAMTGEITLRGRVLPIGGLKEKLLAAKMAGIYTVILPEKNRSDVEELAEEILAGMDIHPVATMDQVLDIALSKEA